MKEAAIFDFDDTLIVGDSLLPFLKYAAGVLPVHAALSAGLAAFAARRALRKPPESFSTFMKDFLIRRLLKGKQREDLFQAIDKICAWQKPNAPIMQALRDHRERGAAIVVASGSLDLYLPALLRDVPHDALICTDVGVKDGVITGDMINGNCVRQRKAERVKAWLEENGPFEKSYGYGNYPPDIPMLNLVKHRIIVS